MWNFRMARMNHSIAPSTHFSIRQIPIISTAGRGRAAIPRQRKTAVSCPHSPFSTGRRCFRVLFGFPERLETLPAIWDALAMPGR